MTLSSRTINIALLLSLALIWGSSYMLIKLGLVSIPPLTIAAARITLAALVLWALMRLRGERLPMGLAQWRPFVFMALCSNVIPFILIAWGGLKIDSGLIGILLGCMPLATLVMAHIFTRDERLTTRKTMGLLFGLAGLMVLVGADALAGVGDHLLGELAIIAAALLYAASTVYAHRFVRTSSTVSSAATLLVASAMILPLSLIIDTPWLLTPTALSLFATAMLGIVGTGAATLIYFRLISAAGATFTSMINYLIPPISVIWGALLLDETPSWRMAIALMLIFTGVTLINRKRGSS